MMSKTKSPLVRGLRVLYLLPLVCLGIGLQAQTAYDLPGKVNQNAGNHQSVNGIKIGPEGANPLLILKQAWGEEKQITREEFNQIESERIHSVEIMKDDAAKEKYGAKADGSVNDVQIMESVCEELDAMMLALVSKSPKWEPATSKGHPVAQFITVPVTFVIR